MSKEFYCYKSILSFKEIVNYFSLSESERPSGLFLGIEYNRLEKSCSFIKSVYCSKLKTFRTNNLLSGDQLSRGTKYTQSERT